MRARRAEILAYICDHISEIYTEPQEQQSIARLVASTLEGVNPTRWLIERDQVVDLPTIEAITTELSQGRPVQYVLGCEEFYGLEFEVKEGVLIPRPETEELVDWARQKATAINKAKVAIIDMCCGSGCIAIALDKSLPEAKITAVELSDAALAIARRNNERLAADVEFVRDDVLTEMTRIKGRVFDIIISNPPYIPRSERATMRRNVTEYEPEMALFVDDTTPLLFYEAIADKAPRLLTEGGYLMFEVHEDYAAETAEMLRKRGFESVEIRDDFRGKPRMICCQKSLK